MFLHVCILFTLQTHLPGYIEKAAELKSKGVDVIACISVNDPFVMDAWGKAHNATGKVSFTNAVDCTFFCSAPFDNRLLCR